MANRLHKRNVSQLTIGLASLIGVCALVFFTSPEEDISILLFFIFLFVGFFYLFKFIFMLYRTPFLISTFVTLILVLRLLGFKQIFIPILLISILLLTEYFFRKVHKKV